MPTLPVVGILASDSRQIGARPLGSPLEGTVVHRFRCNRKMAVALRLRAQRPNHLRVAQVAAFAHVDVLAGEAQWVVRLDARWRFKGMRLDEQRHDFRKAAERNRNEYQDAEKGCVLLDCFVVPVAARHGLPPVSRKPETAPVPAALGLGNGDRDRLDQPGPRRRGGVPEVPRHHHHTGQDDDAGEPAHGIHSHDGDQAVDEWISQRAVGTGGAPHQKLNGAGNPHGEYIDQHAAGVQPEMQLHRGA